MRMPDKQEALNSINPEILERIVSHYKDGAFEFDLYSSEHIVSEGGTVYHVIPRYADKGAESVVGKLRRILARKLEEKE